MNALERLEAAREWLEAGRPARAAAALPAASALPAALRPERDLLEADALRAQGYFDRAERLYRRLLAARDAEPAAWLEAALGSISGLRSLGKVRPGRALAARARTLARRTGSRWALSRLDLEEALLDRAEGRYPRAIARLSSFLRGAKRGRRWQEAAFLLWALGGARRFAGRLEESRRDFAESLALARRAGDPSGEGYALFGLGGVTRIQGRLAESARHYGRARRAFARTEDVFGRAYAECGLANALRQLGRSAEAERHYRSAYALYSSLGDAVDLAYVDWGVGKLHLHRGDLRAARTRFAAARRAFARYGEARGLALSELALAQTLHAAGATAAAEALFDGAWRRARRAGLHAHLEIFT